MSETESYTEAVVETIMEATHSDSEKELLWNRWIALTSIVLTAIAAICSLGASMSSHEGARFRDETTLAIAEHSGKRSVVHILKSQQRLFEEFKLPLDQEVDKVILAFEKESIQLEQTAQLAQQTAEIEKHTHQMFEFASTLLGVSLSFCGLAILLRRKWVWYVGLGLGGLASCFVSIAFIYRVSHF